MKTNQLSELLKAEAERYEGMISKSENRDAVVVAGTLSGLFYSLARVSKDQAPKTLEIHFSDGYWRPKYQKDEPVFLHFCNGSIGITGSRVEEAATIARLHGYELLVHGYEILIQQKEDENK